MVDIEFIEAQREYIFIKNITNPGIKEILIEDLLRSKFRYRCVTNHNNGILVIQRTVQTFYNHMDTVNSNYFHSKKISLHRIKKIYDQTPKPKLLKVPKDENEDDFLTIDY